MFVSMIQHHHISRSYICSDTEGDFWHPKLTVRKWHTEKSCHTVNWKWKSLPHNSILFNYLYDFWYFDVFSQGGQVDVLKHVFETFKNSDSRKSVYWILTVSEKKSLWPPFLTRTRPPTEVILVFYTSLDDSMST